MDHRKIFISLLIALVFSLSGCAAKGPTFTDVKSNNLDKALLYIYRPWAMTGAAVSYQVVLNNVRISPKLSNQSYLVKEIDPGEIVLFTDTRNIDRVLKFTGEAGKTYFVSISSKNYAAMVFEHAAYLVDKDLAIEELKKCKLAL